MSSRDDRGRGKVDLVPGESSCIPPSGGIPEHRSGVEDFLSSAVETVRPKIELELARAAEAILNLIEISGGYKPPRERCQHKRVSILAFFPDGKAMWEWCRTCGAVRGAQTDWTRPSRNGGPGAAKVRRNFDAGALRAFVEKTDCSRLKEYTKGKRRGSYAY